MLLIIILAIFGPLALAKAEETPNDKIFSCSILPQWYLIEIDNKFNFKDVDLSNCTHLMVFDNDFNGDVFKGDEVAVREKDLNKDIKFLGEKYPNLKIILSKNVVNFYVEFSTYKESSKQFFEEINKSVKDRGLTGINLCWNDVSDTFWDVDELMNVKDKFNEFLKELRVSTNFFLTMTFTAALHFFAEESSDFITAIEHVDLVYFMPNQMFFPARAFKSDSIQYAKSEYESSCLQRKIEELIEWEVPESKIVLGIDFRGVSAMSTFGHIDKSKTLGFTGYDEICRRLSSDDASEWEIDDEQTQVSVMAKNFYDSIAKEVFLYKTERAILSDILFIRSRNLAGVMAFPLDMDDFNGECPITSNQMMPDQKSNDDDTSDAVKAEESRAFPLFRSISEALLTTAIQVEQENHNEYEKPSGNEKEDGANAIEITPAGVTGGIHSITANSSGRKQNALNVALLLLGIMLAAV